MWKIRNIGEATIGNETKRPNNTNVAQSGEWFLKNRGLKQKLLELSGGRRMKSKADRLFAAMLLSLLMGFTFCGDAGADHSERSFHAVIASDLHYIASELTDGGTGYQELLKNGDSKYMPYVEEITEAFIEEVLAEHPDVVILTGDLSFNGAEISHLRLCEKLRQLKDSGIAVLVLPGNHDVYNVNAARFQGDSYERVPFATTASFAEIYNEFGPGEALSVDSDSLSYVWELNDWTRVIMLDENTIHDFCGISDTTFDWLKAQLREAREKERFVLVAGHQNLFQHSVFYDGYVIHGAERLEELLRKYEVPLCLSGHLHIQHIRSENGLTEITTSALCSYPCQYALLTAEDGRLRYQTRQLDLAAWAERNGRSDAVFQHFTESAGVYMDAHFTPNTMAPLVDDTVLWAEMLEYIQSMNRAFFSGDMRNVSAMDPDGRRSMLWMKGSDMISVYLQSILKETGTDHNAWEGDYDHHTGDCSLP